MSVLVPIPEPAAQAGHAGSAVTSPSPPASAAPTPSPAPTSTQSSESAAVPRPRAERSRATRRASSAPTGAGVRIEARHDASGGVTITVRGDLGRNDIAVLSRQLHSALENAPRVIVLNVRAVTSADPCVKEVLTVSRARARAANIALHVVDPHHQVTDDR